MVKVLVVEDDPSMGGLVRRGLEEDGYEVTLVSNGIDALTAIAQQHFSAAAIDVMLPEMNGFEICRHIRNQGNPLPVLLLTARDAIEDRVAGLDAGADDYLVKPFAFAEFAARIRALVRRESAPPRSTLSVGSVTLDAATIRATLGERVLALSSKEFALLWMLGSQAGRAASRTEILQEVWGTTQFVDPTIVDQYVSYLRRKLDPGEAGFSIVTLRGVGYAIEVAA